MKYLLLSFAIAAAVFVVVGFHRALRAYLKFRGKRLVSCPGNVVVSVGLLLMVFAVSAQDPSPLNRLPKETPAAAQGKQTYREYCAACHGSDGRGMGPAASALKTPPADLSTLAKRNGGKFPYDYVSDVVRFGKPVVAHGSNDMPVWGPIFAVRDNFNEAAVRQRIKNLCDHLATLQEKES